MPNIEKDWFEDMTAKLPSMHAALTDNMRNQCDWAAANEETEAYADDLATSLPITLSIGEATICMPNLPPVMAAVEAMLTHLSREYLIDLPSTADDNAAVRNKAADLLHKHFSNAH